MKNILLFSIILLLSACSLNNVFLHPTKLSLEKQPLALSYQEDTTIVTFDSLYQPVFLSTQRDTLSLDYEIKSVVFESQSGNKLNAWFMKPTNKSTIATIIHFHGNAGSVVGQHRIMSPLLQAGFQIFMFDYSGFGFSEGKAKRKNVILDGNSAIDYVQTHVDVDEKIILYGQSLGGHLAGVVGTMRENDIDALVLEGAFTSHKAIAKHFAGGFGKLFTKEMYSAKDSIVQFHKPLLIIHSEEDETIPFFMGEQLFECANSPKTFLKIKKTHIFGPIFYTDQIAKQLKTMVNF